jgi:pyruvate, water dikinase
LILKTSGPIIGNSVASRLDRIIYVVSGTYSNLSESERYAAASAIGKIVNHPTSTGKNVALIGPGRWGTTSPSLGVPVSFKEISSVSIICEIAEMHEGLIPDVSLGTHFFNDLVEMDILYLALYPVKEDSFINRDFLSKAESKLKEILPDEKKWNDIIKVIDMPVNFNADVITQRCVFYIL